MRKPCAEGCSVTQSKSCTITHLLVGVVRPVSEPASEGGREPVADACLGSGLGDIRLRAARSALYPPGCCWSCGDASMDSRRDLFFVKKFSRPGRAIGCIGMCGKRCRHVQCPARCVQQSILAAMRSWRPHVNFKAHVYLKLTYQQWGWSNPC